ncbi:MAG: S49 family peptidase [Candidatus Helarchaeota archaeon]
MSPDHLKTYINHKNDIQAGSKLLSSEKIEKIKSEIKSQIKEINSAKLPRNYRVEDDKAIISVTGPLEPKRDICAALFDIDMTTYSDIINSINLAENNNAIKEIIFEINSPGGNVIGLNRAAERIKNVSKPTTALVTDMAASAAYELASQTDKIIAEHSGVEVGSIGVYCECADYTEAYKKSGIEVKAFRSANAPLKNADPFTREGEDQIIKRLTDLETVFFGYVASGRHTTIEDVKENFGQGGILIARDAIKVGMIDTIESIQTKETPIQNKNINNKTEVDSMSEKENITMTQEQLDSAISKAATKAVEEARKQDASENEKKLASEKAENQRVSGFNSLLASFPNQKEMIKSEMEKGNSATADFALKVSEAEQTRSKTAEETNDNSKDIAPSVENSPSNNEKSKANAIAQVCVKGRM